MRRSHSCSLVAAAALIVTTMASPASADAVVIVDGDHFGSSGITMLAQGCADPSTRPSGSVAPVVTADTQEPPLGKWVLGWTPTGQGFAYGPVAHIDRPTALTSFSVDVASPNSLYDTIAVARYVEPNRAGVWLGTWRMPQESNYGWHTVSVPGDAAFQWKHYNTTGQVDDSTDSRSLKNLVNDRGGDNAGADVGILSGCDGDPFYMDALAVETDEDTTTYDFEGYQTRMSLGSRGTKGRSTTITAGEKVMLQAALRSASDGAPVSGLVHIDGRHPGDKRYRKLVARAADDNGDLATTVQPIRTSIIRASYAGNSDTAGSQATFQIRVRTNLTAKRSKKRVVENKTFTVSGRIAPARRATVILQRYVNGKWRSNRKSHTSAKGDYRFEVKSTQIGKTFWRVHVNAGGGNLANNSVWLWIKTVRPPEPHHHGGSGGGSGGSGGGSGQPSTPAPPPSTPPPHFPPPGPLRPGR